MLRTITGIISMLGVIILSASLALATDTINYVGSSTVGKFISAASKIYPQATFTINTRPESSGGESRVATGRASLGGVARELSPEFADMGLRKFLIGHDAIGAWINKSNPINNLTSAQLQKIFASDIKNWQELGGPNKPIHVYIVKATSATYKVFKKQIMGDREYSHDAQIVRPDQKIVAKINNDPDGIGHLSFALGGEQTKTANIKKIAVDGQTPSVNNPQYPITRPLYLITKGAPQGANKKFIDWALSASGQHLVKQWFVGR